MELSNWYIGVKNRYNGVKFVVLEEGLDQYSLILKKLENLSSKKKIKIIMKYGLNKF